MSNLLQSWSCSTCLQDCRSPKKTNSISQAANTALAWSELQEPFHQGWKIFFFLLKHLKHQICYWGSVFKSLILVLKKPKETNKKQTKPLQTNNKPNQTNKTPQETPHRYSKHKPRPLKDLSCHGPGTHPWEYFLCTSSTSSHQLSQHTDVFQKPPAPAGQEARGRWAPRQPS